MDGLFSMQVDSLFMFGISFCKKSLGNMTNDCIFVSSFAGRGGQNFDREGASFIEEGASLDRIKIRG